MCWQTDILTDGQTDRRDDGRTESDYNMVKKHKYIYVALLDGLLLNAAIYVVLKKSPLN